MIIRKPRMHMHTELNVNLRNHLSSLYNRDGEEKGPKQQQTSNNKNIIITMEIYLRLKALNMHTHIMYIEMENVIKKIIYIYILYINNNNNNKEKGQQKTAHDTYSIAIAVTTSDKWEQRSKSGSELRSCVKVEVAILNSQSLIVLTVSVDVKQHWTEGCESINNLVGRGGGGAGGGNEWMNE